MKLLIGGSPCTHWSIAQTKNRETEASGIGWELFLNYRIARDKYRTDYFLYIYCTRDKHLAFMQNQTGTNLIACMDAETAIPVGGFIGNGKIIGEFMCKGFIPFSNGRPCFVAGTPEEIERMARLTRKEIWEYAPQGNPTGWRITDLVIYDAPRELSEFTGLRTEENGFELRTLERPPQSWCYVEEHHDL